MAELAIDSQYVLTEVAARRALTVACQRARFRATDAELIRLGSNAVFRLDAETVGRVAPSLAKLPNATKQIAVSRWLTALGYPVVKATAVEQPVEADNRVVTFWESIAPETVHAPIEQVAGLIRRLHELSAPSDIDLPEARLFGVADDSIPQFESLDQADARFLRDRYAWARKTFNSMTFPLGTGVIHGDANVGNVLVDTRGQAVLIDLDSFSIGPREWDLIQTALFADRFGWHTAEEYRRFVEVYGYDIRQSKERRVTAMSGRSRIEWTEVTWNPTTGCDRVSAGCDHCYALTLAKRLKGMGSAKYQNDGDPRTSGPGFAVTVHEDTLTAPLRWREPRVVFVNSMSDLFHARVPTEFVARVFAMMAATPQHTYQVLTKRATRLRRLAPDLPWPRNVWMGVSVENLDAAGRVDELRAVPAAVRFLSCEPLVGPVDGLDLDGISWVIAGGESGPRARPIDPSWAVRLRDACLAAGVPYFFKQWGGATPKAGGRLLEGRTWDQMPEREMPGTGTADGETCARPSA